jgi:hypothetical protein
MPSNSVQMIPCDKNDSQTSIYVEFRLCMISLSCIAFFFVRASRSTVHRPSIIWAHYSLNVKTTDKTLIKYIKNKIPVQNCAEQVFFLNS